MADNVIMRIMDLFFAFPAILLALFIVAALGPGMNNTILAIAVVYTPIFARVARGPVLALKEIEYVSAARCIGASHPASWPAHFAQHRRADHRPDQPGAFVGHATEAGLSFLGLGTQPPVPSWGGMLSESRKLMEIAPWMAISPGAGDHARRAGL